mgnify:FL=1
MIHFIKHATKLVKSKNAKSRPALHAYHTDADGVSVATDSIRLYSAHTGSAEGTTPLLPTYVDGNYPNVKRLMTDAETLLDLSGNVWDYELLGLIRWLSFAKSAKFKTVDISQEGTRLIVKVEDNNRDSVYTLELREDDIAVQGDYSTTFDIAYLLEALQFLNEYKAPVQLSVTGNQLHAVVPSSPSKPLVVLMAIRKM